MQQYARQTKEVLDFIDRQFLRLSDMLSKAAAKTTKEQFTKKLDLFLKLIAVGMIAVAAAIVAVGKGHAAESAIQREEQRMTDTGDEISRAVLQALEADKKQEQPKPTDEGVSSKDDTRQSNQTSGGK